MAMVAFPFACGITSDDLEDESHLLSFGGLSSSSNQAKQQDDAMSDVDCGATAPDSDSDTESVPSLAATGPMTEPGLQDEENTDEHMIDDAFFEELKGDDDDDKTDGNDATDDNTGDVAMNLEVEDEEPAVSAQATNNSTTQGSFGGLSNLGNTCYLNSALQMVASLDSFAEHLKNNPLPDTHNNNDSESSPKGVLRKAFLEVIESLSTGETVRPNDFKRLLDERTPLFLGYRQQDSHEFLTTLFDLLDEDYKVKPANKDSDTVNNDEPPTSEMVTDANDNDNEGKEEQEGDEQLAEAKEEEMKAETLDSDETKEEETHEPEETVESEPKNEDESEASETYESGSKKPPNVELIESSPTPGENINILASPPRVQSYTDLQPEGIEKLLHANLLVDEQNHSTATTPTPPRCKLVGGRMSAPDNDHDMMLISENDVSTTSMCIACDNSESEEAECSSISPVESYLKTEVRVRLTCESCKYTRAHTESFFHLSLEIGSDNSSVADGLRKFFSPEKRELKCEKCFCETAIQTTEITRLPRALLLHFKRFIVDISDDYTSITYRKNQSDVLFEDKLELAEDKGGVLGEFVAEDVSMPELDFDDTGDRTYQIRSVVNHIGSSAACGHYTADAARVCPSGGRQWNRFNDSYVSSISSEEAMKESSRTAYMVMYELS